MARAGQPGGTFPGSITEAGQVDPQDLANAVAAEVTTQLGPAATQAEMEAGTQAALRTMSPLRVKQAIVALAPQGGGTGVTDGDKTDIIVSDNGATWTIDPAVLTTAGRALVDDADAAAQRATLGLGTMAIQNASGVTITGGTISGIPTTAGAAGVLWAQAGRVQVSGTTSPTTHTTGPTVAMGGYLRKPVALSATGDITAISGAANDLPSALEFADGNATIIHSSNLQLAGGIDWNPGAGDALIFIWDGSAAKEIGRRSGFEQELAGSAVGDMPVWNGTAFVTQPSATVRSTLNLDLVHIEMTVESPEAGDLPLPFIELNTRLSLIVSVWGRFVGGTTPSGTFTPKIANDGGSGAVAITGTDLPLALGTTRVTGTPTAANAMSVTGSSARVLTGTFGTITGAPTRAHLGLLAQRA